MNSRPLHFTFSHTVQSHERVYAIKKRYNPNYEHCTRDRVILALQTLTYDKGRDVKWVEGSSNCDAME